MAESHVVYALKAKRAELAGQIADLEERIASVRIELLHVDGCLRTFGYTEDPATSIRPKRLPAKQLFAPRELPRLIFDHMHAHPEGVTTRAMVDEICRLKGWPAGDARFRGSLVHKVNTKLMKLAAQGLIQAEGEKGYRKTWRLVG
ncbi:MAG: hypothetical protein CMM50_11370 [Rhodospirillaceae bacterium]|nr:hypothetical protein [Rhodospirillaceae bacterium]